MAQGDTVDSLIRTFLKTEVRPEEPSPAVRDSLLAAAAREDVFRSALGPAIPPLVHGLQDRPERAPDLEEPVVTVILLPRRHLLFLVSPLYAVR